MARERQPWDTNRALLAALGTAGGLLALWVGWGLYTSRSAEDVPYERVGTVGGVEVRRYRSRRGHRTNEVAVDVPGSAV